MKNVPTDYTTESRTKVPGKMFYLFQSCVPFYHVEVAEKRTESKMLNQQSTISFDHVIFKPLFVWNEVYVQTSNLSV